MLGTLRPSYYYGRRHDYVYYPESWVDESSGRSYAKGYYDENGQYYENVAFEKDGKYENVVCHCPYCDRDTILNLDAGSAGKQDLECPHCGGKMEIRSELDDVLSQGNENTHTYNSAASLENAFNQKKKKPKIWPLIFGAAVLMLLFNNFFRSRQTSEYWSNGTTVPLTISEPVSYSSLMELGDTVYLNKTGAHTYALAPSDATRGDKVLTWYDDYDSYYDPVSDCYIWYNDAVGIWQYWYEGISSDYGDYGWMEHYDDGWFIEAEDSEWVPLPTKYDQARLWYIA